MSDIILESIRSIIFIILLIFLWRQKDMFLQSKLGWTYIKIGFSLLLFGSLLDITDNFDSLNWLVVVGDTKVEAVLEKLVGSLGGIIFLTIGFIVWVPSVKEQLRNKKYLQDALNAADAGTFSYNLTDNVLEWDDRSFDIFGSDPNIFLKNPVLTWYKHIHIEDVDLVKKKFQNMQIDKSISNFEIEYRFYYGTTNEVHWLKANMDVTRSAQGAVVLCRGLQIETTKEKEILEELRVAKIEAEVSSKSKSIFLANISHELRTPMHGILSFANIGISRIDKVPSSKLLKYFSNIKTSGERLLLLLNDLLDLSKFEAGKMDINMHKADLALLMDRCQLEQKQRLKDLNLTIVTEVAESVGMFDPDKIFQVLSNILSNAIKFSPQNSVIVVTIYKNQAGLKFSIKDQGLGIPEEELEDIFDAFIQSSKTDNKAGGTGLGLAISKNIIEQHGGKIWAANNVKQGAIVSFTLPDVVYCS